MGAPACFELELACRELMEAFDYKEGICGCYLVGSALERPDWRDIDIRFIVDDVSFGKLFPNAGLTSNWEHDARWLVMTTSISDWLSKRTNLPIDFQFQAMTYANARFKGRPRNALGIHYNRNT